MRSRLLWRRLAAAVGLYGSAGLGILGTIVAARLLGIHEFGLFATVMAATGFFQTLLDLTVEESLTKYGFRYIAAERWAKLHRLFTRALELKLVGGLLAAIALVLLAPFADELFGSSGLAVPMLIAAGLPIAQAPENVAATALLLRGRYDVRAASGAASMALRLTAIAIGATFGVAQTIGLMVVAQIIATALVGTLGLHAFRRFPRAAPVPLGDDRSEIISFVARSSIATGIIAGRTTLAPLLLGIAAGPTDVGLFRIAQAPQTGFYALSSPIRLIQLTEQTEKWEHGQRRVVLAELRRYIRAALIVTIISVPIFLVLMPYLIRIVFGAQYEDAATAARIILFAAALQLVFAWTKTLPVSIGRPTLRIVTHGIEALVMLVLVPVLGQRYGVTGAAVAVLVSTIVFVGLWVVLLVRLHGQTGVDTPTDVAVAP